MPRVAPFGSWRSPVSAERIARGGVRLAEPGFAGGEVLWLEGRPAEGGRNVLVRDGADLVPEGFNVRTRVHEYGGGAWLAGGDGIFASSFADQRLYRVEPGADPQPITPEPPAPSAFRYADGRVGPDGLIVCIRESHGDGEAVNELVAVASDGSREPAVVASGADFYAFPRPSPDGRRLAWLEWRHPNMPWDGTELWLADLGAGGALSGARRVAGGPEESIFQPEWSPDGALHFVSDRSGWWNLYRLGDQDAAEPLAPEAAEFGYPAWAFGLATYAFLADGTIVCIRCRHGGDRLCSIRPGAGRAEDLDLPYTAIAPGLRSDGAAVVFVAATPTEGEAVLRHDPAGGGTTVLRRASEDRLDRDYVSVPRAIEFPSAGGRTAHAFYYPPRNPEFEGPEGERPPLIVESHGGPTAHTTPHFDARTQFWTTRGFAVVDVNYGGSTGYGREYRRLLNGTWGVVDTEDCIAAARHLAGRGEADPDRLLIHGGSAGGYTTLCALAFHDDFAAGTSFFGVADAETLARDTHKFESRYMDSLIGPYPERADLYRERSPIHFTDRLSCPLLLLQGLEDEVVPPSQAEAMAAALASKGIPHAYVAFEGEQHGFRRADTIIRCLEAELSFYAQVLGFEPADELEPVTLEPAAGAAG